MCARDVEYTAEALAQLQLFKDNGWGHLPICYG